MTDERVYCFGVLHLALLARLKATLTEAGFACREGAEILGKHTLHKLIAAPPTRPNRAERGCEL